jgi:hypothetical protein
MARNEKSHMEYTRLEIISTVILVCSFVINAFLGIKNYTLSETAQRSQNRIRELATQTDSLELICQKADLSRIKPDVTSFVLLLSGSVLTTLPANKMPERFGDLAPKLQFYDTPLLGYIFDQVRSTKAAMKLEQMQAEFSVFTNRGSMPARNFTIYCANPSAVLEIGTIDPHSSVLIAAGFLRGQPYERKLDSRKLLRFSYRNVVGDDTTTTIDDIEPKKNICWMPVLGSMTAIGKAVISSETDVLKQ